MPLDLFDGSLSVDHWLFDAESGSFVRAMGKLETCFAFDGLHYGVANCLLSVTARGPTQLLTYEAIRAAWQRLRRRHPLLAARVVFSSDRTASAFRVNEDRIEDEGSIEMYEGTAEECRKRVMAATHIEIDCRERVSKLIVCHSSAPSPSTGTAVDLVLLMNHCINDLNAQMTTMRGLFEELAKEKGAMPELEEALTTVPSFEGFFRHKTLSLPLQRWRRATAKIILQRKAQRQQGGKTMPKQAIHAADALPFTLCLTRELDEVTSARIATAARKTGVPFGMHHSVFGHIALLRTLHRLRAAGRLQNSEEEWTAMLRQPFHVMGPLNLRPSIGYPSDAVACCISYQSASFPSLVPSSSSVLPSYDEICPRRRYHGRVKSARDQLRTRLNHPLFTDISDFFSEGFLATRPAYGGPRPAHAPSSHAGTPLIAAFGGSSLGRLDGILPARYGGDLELSNVGMGLRVRPGELYIGSYSLHGRLYFIAHVDEATFERAHVEVLLDEFVGAARHYLDAKERESRL